MTNFLPIASRPRKQLFAMLAITSVAMYFGYHLLNGNNGLLALMQLQHKVDQAHIYLDEARMERLKLEHRVKMMSPESLDLDLLDEQARKNLGYAKENEIIYIVPEEK